jgi:hypothetical protein
LGIPTQLTGVLLAGGGEAVAHAVALPVVWLGLGRSPRSVAILMLA